VIALGRTPINPDISAVFGTRTFLFASAPDVLLLATRATATAVCMFKPMP
jgi:hypothetical protein